MSLSNQERDRRIIKLLCYAGLPTLFIIALSAALHGNAFLLYALGVPALTVGGITLVRRSSYYVQAYQRYLKGRFKGFPRLFLLVCIVVFLFSFMLVDSVAGLLLLVEAAS